MAKVNSKFKSIGSANGVKISRPVSAFDWKILADNANYLCSRGNQLIPVSSFTSGGLPSGSQAEPFPFEYTYNYKLVLFPSTNSTTRLWKFGRAFTTQRSGRDSGFPHGGTLLNGQDLNYPRLKMSGASEPFDGSNGGGFVTDYNAQMDFEITQWVSQSEATSSYECHSFDLEIMMTSSGLAESHLNHRSWFYCSEHPRKDVYQSGSDVGVNDDFYFAKQINDQTEYDGMRGVLNTTNNALREARKAGQFYYVRPYKLNGSVIQTAISGILGCDSTTRWFGANSGSINGVGIPLQVSPKTTGDLKLSAPTTGSVSIYVYGAAANNGESIQIDLTSSWLGGGTIDQKSFNITFSGSWVPQWHSYAFTGSLGLLQVGCDTTSSTNTPTNGTSILKWNRRQTSGTGALIYSFCIGDWHPNNFTDF